MNTNQSQNEAKNLFDLPEAKQRAIFERAANESVKRQQKVIDEYEAMVHSNVSTPENEGNEALPSQSDEAKCPDYGVIEAITLDAIDQAIKHWSEQ